MIRSFSKIHWRWRSKKKKMVAFFRRGLYFWFRPERLRCYSIHDQKLWIIMTNSPSSSLVDISNEEINNWVQKTSALQRTIKGIAEGTLDPVSGTIRCFWWNSFAEIMHFWCMKSNTFFAFLAYITFVIFVFCVSRIKLVWKNMAY